MHGIFSSLAWSFVLRMSDQLNSRELNGHTFWKIGCFVVRGSCFLQKIWHFGAVFSHLPTESWGGTSMPLPTAMPSCGRYAVHRIGSFFLFSPGLGETSDPIWPKHFFQMGWFNHHLAKNWKLYIKSRFDPFSWPDIMFFFLPYIKYKKTWKMPWLPSTESPGRFLSSGTATPFTSECSSWDFRPWVFSLNKKRLIFSLWRRIFVADHFFRFQKFSIANLMFILVFLKFGGVFLRFETSIQRGFGIW